MNFWYVVGWTNVPPTFMSLMDEVFEPCIDFFVIVFTDEILVYSKSEKEHANHIRTILDIL